MRKLGSQTMLEVRLVQLANAVQDVAHELGAGENGIETISVSLQGIMPEEVHRKLESIGFLRYDPEPIWGKENVRISIPEYFSDDENKRRGQA